MSQSALPYRGIVLIFFDHGSGGSRSYRGLMQARRERFLQRQLSDLMGQWQKAVCSACIGGGPARASP